MLQKRSIPTCLLVEDDGGVRECLSVLVEEMGYRVETARDGSHATVLLTETVSPDFILLDMTVPQTDGGGLLCWLETHRPDLLGRVVLMTGTVRGPSHVVWEQSHLPKLHKPISWEALQRSIRSRVPADHQSNDRA